MGTYPYSGQIDGKLLAGRVASMGLPSTIAYPVVMGTTTSWGNADTLVSSDGVHPSAEGHRMLAYVQAQLLRNYLTSLTAGAF